MQARGVEGGRAVPSKRSDDSDASGAETGAMSVPTTDDEIQEKYLERAIRELNQLTHRLQDCSALPPRQPDAGARLRAPAGRRYAAQVRPDRGRG